MQLVVWVVVVYFYRLAWLSWFPTFPFLFFSFSSSLSPITNIAATTRLSFNHWHLAEPGKMEDHALLYSLFAHAAFFFPFLSLSTLVTLLSVSPPFLFGYFLLSFFPRLGL